MYEEYVHVMRRRMVCVRRDIVKNSSRLSVRMAHVIVRNDN